MLMSARWFTLALAYASSVFSFGDAVAQPAVNRSAETLMVVLRELPGVNTPEESLKPIVGAKAMLPDGKEVDVDLAWFVYLGDMQLRFVFDGEKSAMSASQKDLADLKLTPEQALALAVANIKRVYGKPKSVAWKNGFWQVEGKSPDLDSSYFLDKEFWNELLQKHPDGVIVAVPKRGGLLYVPASNQAAVENLRQGVVAAHTSSGRMRVSSALYQFKDGRWSVFQHPGNTEKPQ